MGTLWLKMVVAQSDCFYTVVYKCCISTSPIATDILPDLSRDGIKSSFFEGLRENGCNSMVKEQGINLEQM